MKEKIYNQLKQEYARLGLSDELLQSVAASLEATGLVTDENLATVVKGQENMLKSYQSNFDKLRTEGAGYKKELEELKAKGRVKSATYHQLMGRKMMYQNMLSMYELYDLISSR